jgi:GNAT superfamily N-acetyltransferase
MPAIRPCRDDERPQILAIVNAAAEAYRGVIPADRWREPYMPADELDREIAAGVAFWGYEVDGALAGIMGVQPVRDVDLIRHAYVAPVNQGRGIGSALLEQLAGTATTRRVLVGTWAAADWAIRLYARHGFELVSPPERKAELLRTYWNIPERQIETSVVLAKAPTSGSGTSPVRACAGPDSARASCRPPPTRASRAASGRSSTGGG